MKKQICKFCGRISNHWLCNDCLSETKNKSLRDFFKEEKHLINLLTKDCLFCPLHNSNFCNIIYENPQNEQQERILCYHYVKTWLDHYEHNQIS